MRDLKRNEFFLLEEYLNEHFANLRKGNPFIAHRGFIGISKDLLDVDSHDAQQAKLMWDYFQIVNGREDIELEEMYQMFVLGWNGELSEDNCFCKHFSGATAQLFVLMMDSLDVLVGRKQIDDNSLLINDDPKIWNMMVDARCWDDVGRRGYT